MRSWSCDKNSIRKDVSKCVMKDTVFYSLPIDWDLESELISSSSSSASLELSIDSAVEEFINGDLRFCSLRLWLILFGWEFPSLPSISRADEVEHLERLD